MKAQKFILLIVDDDENDRYFIQTCFERLDARYRVQGVSSGHEAIAYLKGEGRFHDRDKFQFPSYIITDLKMPDGDGLHLLEFIKTNPALSIIPVVMLSGSQDPEDIRRAYLLGASSFFSKPLSPLELKALVNSIHEYQAQCEVPAVDEEGYAILTEKGRPLFEAFQIR
jgi:CheY-like chemotaxis protein